MQAYFQGIQKPTSDFQRIRDGRQAGPFVFEVDLSVQRGGGSLPMVLNISGNVLYIDDVSNAGRANITFEDVTATNSYVSAGPGFKCAVAFTQIKIENAAQPGKKLRIVYGVDIDLNPTTPEKFAISKTTEYLPVSGMETMGGNADGLLIAWRAYTTDTARIRFECVCPVSGIISSSNNFFMALCGADIYSAEDVCGSGTPITFLDRVQIDANNGILSFDGTLPAGVYSPVPGSRPYICIFGVENAANADLSAGISSVVWSSD